MENLEIRGSETQAIIDLASSIKPIEIAGQAHIKRVALPPDWVLTEKDDEDILDQPVRKKGTVNLHDADSYIAYINRHKITEQSTIYVNADYSKSEVAFKCILNDHAAANDGQQWRDYYVIYNPKKSVEWNRWIEKNYQRMTQFEFALFLEENLQDIAAAQGFPTGTELLEMALSFQATQDMRYKSAIRIQSGGINMSFVQDDDAGTLQTMKVFEKIAIGIPVFRNGSAYQMTARLRYRVAEGQLRFWYELVRPDKILEDAVKKMIERIETETEVPLYFGTP